MGREKNILALDADCYNICVLFTWKIKSHKNMKYAIE